jgi:hypothetical protein
MEITDLLEKRLQELVTVTKTLSAQASEHKFRTAEIINEIKASGTTDRDRDNNRKLVTEMKKINSFSYVKSNEVGINVRIMNEIYSFMKYLDFEPQLPPEDIEILEFNLANVKPTFILDKGEVVFFSKEAEDFVMEKMSQPDSRDDDYIEKIRTFNNEDGKG